LEFDPSVVYMGEDVQHGGYYVVTEGLAQRFPGRVVDFPPDETSLLGAALGFAQSGLLPIVEIPYAKYLDCGADMFAEIALTHWLSGSSRRSNGMVIRLQGFDRGLFGGNFHTHNALAPPPGVDLLCFSNGEDYVRGFRHAMLQAKAGRIAVIVDCTHLLNLRHLFGKDRAWERPYPPNDEHGLLNFDEIRRFGTNGHVAIVSFGTGVVAALQARRTLFETQHITCENEIDIIDCPCVSCFSDSYMHEASVLTSECIQMSHPFSLAFLHAVADPSAFRPVRSHWPLLRCRLC
jgi:2-oxoisovalerate dehydrogenase E1 component